jgi:hypothetical protein
MDAPIIPFVTILTCMHMCPWQRGTPAVMQQESSLPCTCAVAKTIVNMEQSYVTAAFFRHRTAERYKAMIQAQQTAKLLGEGERTSPFVPRTLG